MTKQRKTETTLEWLERHVWFSGDECLIWPFGRARGYAIVSIGRHPAKAYRVMCEMIHGAAPTRGHEASHSCGKGHEGCVNPKHLSWKTRTENQRDRRRHGTAGNGGMGRRRRLTIEQVQIVRSGDAVTVTDLAKRFGVTRSAIRKIQTGETWQHLHKSKERGAILTMLSSKQKPMSAAEIAETQPQGIIAVYDLLSKMAREGQIERVSRGIYSLPKTAACT